MFENGSGEVLYWRRAVVALAVCAVAANDAAHQRGTIAPTRPSRRQTRRPPAPRAPAGLRMKRCAARPRAVGVRHLVGEELHRRHHAVAVSHHGAAAPQPDSGTQPSHASRLAASSSITSVAPPPMASMRASRHSRSIGVPRM